MSANLHRHAVLNTGALHIAYGAAPQIMKEQARYAGPLAGFRPPVEMIVHQAAVGSVEHPGTPGWARFALALQPPPHIPVDWQGARAFGLRLGHRKPDQPGCKGRSGVLSEAFSANFGSARHAGPSAVPSAGLVGH